MDKWRARLHGYTGLFIVFAIWTPVTWFIYSARTRYEMETFELHRMHWPVIVIFVVLLVATVAAQFGFLSIARDLSKFEAMKKLQPRYEPFRKDADA